MSTNDITGDAIISKKNSELFRDNFDKIFKKNECKRCGKINHAKIHTCTPKEYQEIKNDPT